MLHKTEIMIVSATIVFSSIRV